MPSQDVSTSVKFWVAERLHSSPDFALDCSHRTEIPCLSAIPNMILSCTVTINTGPEKKTGKEEWTCEKKCCFSREPSVQSTCQVFAKAKEDHSTPVR